MGTFYLVSVPSDHREDLTLRAERTLRESWLVLARDVERVRELLAKCDIPTPLLALDLGDATRRPERILDALVAGDVSWAVLQLSELSADAARFCRTLVDCGVNLVSVPGPCAEITALVTSGLPANGFTFLGLLPASASARRLLLQGVAEEHLTLVCEVQDANLSSVLGDVQDTLGDRQMALWSNQVLWRGRASQVPLHVGVGELVLVMEGAEQDLAWTEAKVRSRVRKLLDMGKSPRDVAREVASHSGWPKRRVYELCRLVEQDRI